MVYKFRIILDNEDDIFRDIAITNNATLEDLHNAIVNSFGFDGTEVGSFYTCNNTWEQEDEIPQFDAGEEIGQNKIMSDFILKDILDESNTKIIYVYDFLNMWTFFVELAAIEEINPLNTYPEILFAHGTVPNDNSGFSVTTDDIYGEFEDDIDEDDYFNDEFEQEDEDPYGFQEDTWN
jgi:hypothetical protein